MKPNWRMIVLFLLPALVCYLFFFLYPTLRTAYFSLFEVDSFSAPEMRFRGLGNYTELLRTNLFIISLSNILKIWVIGGLAIFGFTFLFAALLASGLKGKGFFRAVVYLPNILPVVAMAAMWTQYIYNPRYGLLKTFFEWLGLESLAGILWTSLDMLFWSMLIALVWGGIGWFVLIILAGIEQIPTDYYDAAKVDGANQFQTFFSITLPMIRDIFKVALVMWSISVLNLFAFPKAFTPVVQPKETMTPATYMYELAFSEKIADPSIGEATAVAVIILLLVLVIYGITGRLFGKESLEY